MLEQQFEPSQSGPRVLVCGLYTQPRNVCCIDVAQQCHGVSKKFIVLCFFLTDFSLLGMRSVRVSSLNSFRI